MRNVEVNGINAFLGDSNSVFITLLRDNGKNVMYEIRNTALSIYSTTPSPKKTARILKKMKRDIHGANMNGT
jgi:tryptophanase